MPEIVSNVFKLLVGIALFIVGMNMMIGGLQKVAGRSLKRLFSKIKNNRFISMGIGAGITGIIQSSGATSAMTVGFINAGVISMFQGICIVLGAHIGSCVTGVLVSLSSFPISQCFIVLAFVGVVFTFIHNAKIKQIGEILAGFGILFFGLSTMSSAVTGELLDAFKTMFTAIDFPLLLLVVGMLFTCLTQSSSATSGIVIILVQSHALTLTSGIYLVIGATVGTLIPTLLTSLNGNVDSKRTAFICLFERVVSALIGIVVVWPVEVCCDHAISNGLTTLFGGNLSIALAMFLVIFNVVTVAIILPFVQPMVDMSKKLIKDKAALEKRKAIKFLDERMMIEPTIALGQAKDEILNMLTVARKNMNLAMEVVYTQDLSKQEEIKNREDEVDYINITLTDFLIKLTNKVTSKQENKIGAYFHSINDIERIGDHAINLVNTTISMKENGLHFSNTPLMELRGMYAIVDEMFDAAYAIFKRKDFNTLKRLAELNKIAEDMKHELSFAHFERITKDNGIKDLSSYFTGLIIELERVANHLVNVGYSVINPVGDVDLILETTFKH